MQNTLHGQSGWAELLSDSTHRYVIICNIIAVTTYIGIIEITKHLWMERSLVMLLDCGQKFQLAIGEWKRAQIFYHP